MLVRKKRQKASSWVSREEKSSHWKMLRLPVKRERSEERFSIFSISLSGEVSATCRHSRGCTFKPPRASSKEEKVELVAEKSAEGEVKSRNWIRWCELLEVVVIAEVVKTIRSWLLNGWKWKWSWSEKISQFMVTRKNSLEYFITNFPWQKLSSDISNLCTFHMRRVTCFHHRDGDEDDKEKSFNNFSSPFLGLLEMEEKNSFPSFGERLPWRAFSSWQNTFQLRFRDFLRRVCCVNASTPEINKDGMIANNDMKHVVRAVGALRFCRNLI